MMKSSPSVESITGALREHGIFHLPGAGPDVLEEVLGWLGTVIHVTDVAVDPESRRLISSDEALDLHTDHHRADVIVWHCIEQSDEGGESVLLDAEAAYGRLTPEQQRLLEAVQLIEHRVFPEDEGTHPLVRSVDGRRKFYFALWMLDEPESEAQGEALNAFQAALAGVPRRLIKLQPGDLLGIDNGRMLHGRTAIGGNRQRLLRRYWVQTH
jgi:hypothetical protein